MKENYTQGDHHKGSHREINLITTLKGENAIWNLGNVTCNDFVSNIDGTKSFNSLPREQDG